MGSAPNGSVRELCLAAQELLREIAFHFDLEEGSAVAAAERRLDLAAQDVDLWMAETDDAAS